MVQPYPDQVEPLPKAAAPSQVAAITSSVVTDNHPSFIALPSSIDFAWCLQSSWYDAATTACHPSAAGTSLAVVGTFRVAGIVVGTLAIADTFPAVTDTCRVAAGTVVACLVTFIAVEQVAYTKAPHWINWLDHLRFFGICTTHYLLYYILLSFLNF